MCQLSPVTFHGDTIFCVTLENQPFTPAKPIVENLGLNWRTQAAKLRANRERWGVAMIATPSESGEQETTCIPVRKLPAFLASINPKKVRAELRERIELYQAECDDALWNYWMNGRAERQPEPVRNSDRLDSRISKRTDPERKALTAIINTWVGMAPIHYASARAQVNAHFGVASVDALTVAQVKEAIQWVQAKIDALPPAPAQPALPAVPEKDKFEAYIEKVEQFRAEVRKEMYRLEKEGVDMVNAYKFGTGNLGCFIDLISLWLRDVVISPTPLIGNDCWNRNSGLEASPIYLIKTLEKVLTPTNIALR